MVTCYFLVVFPHVQPFCRCSNKYTDTLTHFKDALLHKTLASQSQEKLVQWNHFKKTLSPFSTSLPWENTFKKLSKFPFVQFSCYKTFHTTFEKLSVFLFTVKIHVFVWSGAELVLIFFKSPQTIKKERFGVGMEKTTGRTQKAILLFHIKKNLLRNSGFHSGK